MRYLLAAAWLAVLVVSGWYAFGQTRAPAASAVRHIDATGSPARTARLMVNEGAYLMAERAFAERDDRQLFWVWRNYDYFDVAHGTTIVLIAVDGPRNERRYHVEVLDGEHAGRRGWVPWAYVSHD